MGESMGCQWRLIIACCSLAMVSQSLAEVILGVWSCPITHFPQCFNEHLNVSNENPGFKKSKMFPQYVSSEGKLNGLQTILLVQLSFTSLSHVLGFRVLQVRLMVCANWQTLNGISLSLQ